MATNVPPVTFGPNGFSAPEASAVLAGVIADFQEAFGGNLNLSVSNPSSLSTPQGQLASSMTALIVQANADFLIQSTQTDPAYAFGRWQDAIARIYFIFRVGSTPTVLQIQCNGLANLPITVGATIIDEDENVYACTQAGVIGSGGSVTLPFANQVSGPIAVPSQVEPFQIISGWDSATVVSGALGTLTEGRQDFEARRATTVAGNSFGAAGSIAGAVSKVAGVTDFFPYDNSENTAVTVLGVSIAKNSLYIAVVGGTDQDVAQAILSKKNAGCSYTGNTTVTAYDNNPLYSAPIAYQVKFQRPSGLQILFAVNLVSGPTVPSNAATLIQNAIVNAFGGGDDGPRARIGGTILATRFVEPVVLLGSWARVRSLQVGSNNATSATFTGAIAGTALTAGSITGTIAIGQTVIGAGVLPGTRIVSGSGGSWVVNVSQTVASEAMTSAVASLNEVDVDADQAPQVDALNIVVTVT